MAKIDTHAPIVCEYTGPLAKPIQNFVIEKRRIGYKFNGEAVLLRELDRFAESQGSPTNCLPKDLVLKWCEKQPTHSPKTHQTRCCVVRALGEYMARHGYESYISAPMATGICEHGSFVPYIFSDEELGRFFQQIDKTPQSGHSPHQHVVYPLLFRILYSCGLRLNEALSLKVRNVDLQSGTLTILGAKFDKDRLVPIHEALFPRMNQYAALLHKNSSPDELFFSSPEGGFYSHSAVYNRYRLTLKNAGINYGGRGKGPRIHDFRHTFAIHCLRQWMKDGVDVENAMKYLSAYMGHVNTQCTHTYLRLTTELFPEILSKVEAYAGFVIPSPEEEPEYEIY